MNNKSNKSNWRYFEFDVRSRYGDIRTIKPIDVENGVYKVMGKAHYCRRGDNMFDFEGGPCFFIDDDFYHLGTISEIKSSDSGIKGYEAVEITVSYNKKSSEEVNKWLVQNRGQ